MAANDPSNDPSLAAPPPLRRIFRAAVIMVIVLVICALAYGAWDRLSEMGAWGGTCGSDRLAVSAIYVREYTEQHEGRLPPSEDLLTVAAGPHQIGLGCDRMQLPFQWDLRLAGKKVDDLDQRALAWCPPGGHGQYVAAIVVEGGSVRFRTLSIAELKTRVGDYYAK